ncbi:hypothetical protein Fmac_026628 [Flemingia macrophylla]|uniref:Uncharacterized protein n=1 Tax=Flemingia macrophylla TaxID=520843 RepID=A0ABD1LFD8_9FABA
MSPWDPRLHVQTVLLVGNEQGGMCLFQILLFQKEATPGGEKALCSSLRVTSLESINSHTGWSSKSLLGVGVASKAGTIPGNLSTMDEGIIHSLLDANWLVVS